MNLIGAFLFGAVFALGLGLAGMTQPARIIGFLDVTGQWDPTLAVVMGSAVAVSATLFPLILKRQTPVIGDRFVLPQRRAIDARLVTGAALFGVGWGLSGYCPGPAVVSLVTAAPPVLMFVVCMAVGLYVGELLLRGAATQEHAGAVDVEDVCG
jgi:uncharacterized membrane protein YedE/YeeE